MKLRVAKKICRGVISINLKTNVAFCLPSKPETFHGHRLLDAARKMRRRRKLVAPHLFGTGDVVNSYIWV